MVETYVVFGSIECLAFTRPFERRALDRALAENLVSGSVSRASFRAFKNGELDHAEFLRNEIGRCETFQKKVLQDAEHHFQDLLDENTPIANSWAFDAICEKRERSIKVGLVANSTRQTVNRILAAIFGHRASSVLDFCVCGEGSFLSCHDQCLRTQLGGVPSSGTVPILYIVPHSNWRDRQKHFGISSRCLEDARIHRRTQMGSVPPVRRCLNSTLVEIGLRSLRKMT